MNKVQLFQERILTDAEQLALATGAAVYRWEDLTKAPVSPSMFLNPRRYGDGAKDLWTTLNCVQENIAVVSATVPAANARSTLSGAALLANFR
jgi:hypothetical protein